LRHNYSRFEPSIGSTDQGTTDSSHPSYNQSSGSAFDAEQLLVTTGLENSPAKPVSDDLDETVKTSSKPEMVHQRA